MPYELFKELLINIMRDEFPNGTFKYNLTEPDHTEQLICYFSSDNPIPAINVSGLYQRLLEDGFEKFPDVFAFFIATIRETMEHPDVRNFSNFEKIKDCIYCRLVNTNRNVNLKEEALLFPYLNLDVIFYIKPNRGKGNFDCEYILAKEVLENWNITVEELFALAKRNFLKKEKPSILPASLLEDLKILPFKIPEEFLNYTIFCPELKYASTMLLFPDFFEILAQDADSDLYLFPFSEDELLIEKTTKPESALRQTFRLMTKDGQKSFSNKVYMYRKGSRQISIVLDAVFYKNR